MTRLIIRFYVPVSCSSFLSETLRCRKIKITDDQVKIYRYSRFVKQILEHTLDIFEYLLYNTNDKVCDIIVEYERTWSLNLLPQPNDDISFHPRFPNPRFPHSPCKLCQPWRLPHDGCKFCQSCARLPHAGVFKFCQPRLPQPDTCKSRHARFSSWSSSNDRV